MSWPDDRLDFAGLPQQPDLLPDWLDSKAEGASASCFTGDSAASVRGLQDTTSTPASDADCILDLLDWLPTVSASTDLQPSSMVLNERSPPYPIDTPELRLAHSTCSGSFLESGCLTDLLEAPEGWQDVPKVWQESSCNPHAQLPSMRSESSSFTEPELKPSIGLSLPPCSTATPGDLYLSTLDSSDPWPDTSLMLDGMMPFDILDDAAQLSDLDSLSDLPAAEHSGPSTAQPPSSLSRETSCTISSISSTLEPAPAVGQRTTRRYKQKTGRPRRYDTYVAPVEEPEGEVRICGGKRRGAPQRHAYSTQEEGLAKRRDRNRNTALNSYYKRKERTAQLEAEKAALERENAALREILQAIEPMQEGQAAGALTDLVPQANPQNEPVADPVPLLDAVY